MDIPSEYVVVDVETTGLSPFHGDRICEIGLVRVKNREIHKTYEQLINPERPISPGAAQVNGITEAMLYSAPNFYNVAHEILSQLTDIVVVCHNAPFDIGFIKNEFNLLGIDWAPSGVIDTLQIARNQFRFQSNSLASIATFLRIQTPNAHRALADALTTHKILLHFLGKDESSGWIPASDSSTENPVDLKNVNLLPPELTEFLQTHEDINLTYMDAKGTVTTRRITPFEIEYRSDAIYLIAFCHLRKSERSFRLDRVIKYQRIEL